MSASVLGELIEQHSPLGRVRSIDFPQCASLKIESFGGRDVHHQSGVVGSNAQRLRIVVALLFLQHGLAKHFGFPHVPSFDNLQPFSLIGLAGAIEIVGSLLLLFGFLTRPVAFVMSGEMAVAYFMAHAPRGFFPILNQGELAVLYCFVFLYFAVVGGGAWSIDRMRGSAGRTIGGIPGQGTF